MKVIIGSLLLLAGLHAGLTQLAMAQGVSALTLQHAYTINQDGGLCVYGFLVTAAPDVMGGFQQIDIALSAVTDEPVNREIRHLEIASLGKPGAADWVVREALFLCGVPEITLISAVGMKKGSMTEFLENNILTIVDCSCIRVKLLER